MTNPTRPKLKQAVRPLCTNTCSAFWARHTGTYHVEPPVMKLGRGRQDAHRIIGKARALLPFHMTQVNWYHKTNRGWYAKPETDADIPLALAKERVRNAYGVLNNVLWYLSDPDDYTKWRTAAVEASRNTARRAGYQQTHVDVYDRFSSRFFAFKDMVSPEEYATVCFSISDSLQKVFDTP